MSASSMGTKCLVHEWVTPGFGPTTCARCGAEGYTIATIATGTAADATQSGFIPDLRRIADALERIAVALERAR